MQHSIKLMLLQVSTEFFYLMLVMSMVAVLLQAYTRTSSMQSLSTSTRI